MKRKSFRSERLRQKTRLRRRAYGGNLPERGCGWERLEEAAARPGIELPAGLQSLITPLTLQALQTHVLQNPRLRSGSCGRLLLGVQRRSGPRTPGPEGAASSRRREGRRLSGGSAAGACLPRPAGPGSPASALKAAKLHLAVGVAPWESQFSGAVRASEVAIGETAAQRLSPLSVTADPGGRVHLNDDIAHAQLLPNPRVTARHRPRPRPLASSSNSRTSKAMKTLPCTPQS